MKIMGVKYSDSWVSVTVDSGTAIIQESITSAKEARQLQRELFQVVEELEDFAVANSEAKKDQP